jgi:hypothetical protein
MDLLSSDDDDDGNLLASRTDKSENEKSERAQNASAAIAFFVDDAEEERQKLLTALLREKGRLLPSKKDETHAASANEQPTISPGLEGGTMRENRADNNICEVGSDSDDDDAPRVPPISSCSAGAITMSDVRFSDRVAMDTATVVAGNKRLYHDTLAIDLVEGEDSDVEELVDDDDSVEDVIMSSVLQESLRQSVPFGKHEAETVDSDSDEVEVLATKVPFRPSQFSGAMWEDVAQLVNSSSSAAGHHFQNRLSFTQELSGFPGRAELLPSTASQKRKSSSSSSAAPPSPKRRMDEGELKIDVRLEDLDTSKKGVTAPKATALLLHLFPGSKKVCAIHISRVHTCTMYVYI